MLNCAMPRASLADGAEGVGEAFGKRTTISVTWYYLFLRSIFKLGFTPITTQRCRQAVLTLLGTGTA